MANEPTDRTDHAVGLVVGAGGLLGSAVAGSLHRVSRLSDAAPRFDWGDADRFAGQFSEALAVTLEQARRLDSPWAVYWCAGVGHVGASDEALRAEDRLLESALAVLAAAEPPHPGVFSFASSAGAIYAASKEPYSTEATPPAPLSEYGRAKLRQEALIGDRLAVVGTAVPLHLRISNLYGRGQELVKPQGLLSHLVANTLRRQPTTIFVPLDTSRDYLHASSAAQMAVFATDEMAGCSDAIARTRLVAAERNHSVAQIIGALTRLLRRRVPFVVARQGETHLQPLVLRFRSVDRRLHLLDNVPLDIGLASVIDAARGWASSRAA